MHHNAHTGIKHLRNLGYELDIETITGGYDLVKVANTDTQVIFSDIGARVISERNNFNTLVAYGDQDFLEDLAEAVLANN